MAAASDRLVLPRRFAETEQGSDWLTKLKKIGDLVVACLISPIYLSRFWIELNYLMLYLALLLAIAYLPMSVDVKVGLGMSSDGRSACATCCSCHWTMTIRRDGSFQQQ